jgi:arginyl-tRNA synthetase
MNIKQTIKNKIKEVLNSKYNLIDFDFTVDYPPKPELGDYSANVAMLVAKEAQKNPLLIAEEIIAEIKKENPVFLSRVEVVKPGFINFYLTEDFLKEKKQDILKEGTAFGSLQNDQPKKIQLEFISANPTGPLTLANGRGGFSGDVLAGILKLAGNEVEKEYYVNDFGNQINMLGHSVLKDEEAQYSGDYIDQLHQNLNSTDIDQEDPMQVGFWACDHILSEYIKPAVAQMGVDFDVWFSEKELHESGQVSEMLTVLREKDLTFDRDEAIWFKSTNGENSEDDKDRVLVKSDGNQTYFLSDIAYHWDKFFKRKFDQVINIWGADHHGYVPRMKTAMTALGYPGQLEILLVQLVRLIKDGEELKMSKRKGIYILMSDLLEELSEKVGEKFALDVVRFFFLMHSNNKKMDFDLDLAMERSKKNPVFYVQYAHARICSIVDKVKDLPTISSDQAPLDVAEKELIKELIKWPELVSEVAGSYEVHKVAFYAISIADYFHNFYEKCRVIDNDEVLSARLETILATKQVLENVLSCLGVSAPEEM